MSVAAPASIDRIAMLSCPLEAVGVALPPHIDEFRFSLGIQGFEY